MFQGTSSKSGQNATDVIRLIDLRVDNLRESIRVLHSQRNSYLPISKLPVEILSKIFLLHQKNMTQNWVAQKARLDWIRITHVSQRWREVALNFSGLWIHIPFHNPKWAKEMIARSQPAALIVKAPYPGYHPASKSQAKLLKSFLQQHLSRVQVLHILHARPQLVAKLFQDIQPTSVPYLSTLSLSMQFEERGTNSSDSLQIIDSRLLNAKSLRKVEVSTALGWDCRLFNGLTHLSLGNGDRDMARSQTSQRDFLDALCRMPTLQRLHLKGPVLPEAVDGSLEPVYLPDLRDLIVFDTVSTIEFFLNHVIFSATTRTSIGCKHLGPVVRFADISPVLVPLKRLLSERPRTQRLRHIEFSFHEDSEDWSVMTNLRFQGWAFPGPSSLKGYNTTFPSGIPDFTFFVEWNPEVAVFPPDINEFSVGVFRLFPEDDVVSLSLLSYDIADAWFIPFFRKISRLPALNAVFLDQLSSLLFLLEFDHDVSQEGVNPSMATYPALLYLDFRKCILNTVALKTLYKCLKKRSANDLGLQKLRVDLRILKNVDKKIIALLEKFAEIVWMESDCDDSVSDLDSVQDLDSVY